MNSNQRRIAAALGAVAIVIIALLAVRRARDGFAPQDVRARVVATIQSEARESFLITGSIDLTATTTIENTRKLLPGLLDINLGTSRATVQVPGRAYYGFDVRTLDADRIIVRGDTVEMAVPEPHLLSVDANLQELKIWSQKGWLRTPASVHDVERAAIQRIDNALAHQAAVHVASSTQPRVNSARALRKMLTPVLIAAGLQHPVFRFTLGEHLTITE